MEGFPRSLFADMMPQNRARIGGSKFIKCLFCSNQGLLVPPRGKATQQVTRITAFPDTPRWGATTGGTPVGSCCLLLDNMNVGKYISV